MMNAAHHHLVKRRSAGKRLGKWTKFLDDIVYVGAIFGPIATVPQLLKIWSEKTTAGVSVWTWAGYAAGAVVWLAYGYAHREKPIILSNVLFLVISVLIVIGVLVYS